MTKFFDASAWPRYHPHDGHAEDAPGQQARAVEQQRLIGALFMGLGVLAILTPPDWGNFWLALGFGGLQIGFGVSIARNHGG